MELTQKGEMVSRLQAKAGQIGKILNNLEKYNHLIKDSEKRSAEKRHSFVKSESRELSTKKIETVLEKPPQQNSTSENKMNVTEAKKIDPEDKTVKSEDKERVANDQ